MPQEREKIELKELTSFKDLMIEGPELQMDLDEDAWSYGAPPPRDCYEFKWFPAKNFAKSGYEKDQDQSTFFVQANIEGRLVNNSVWEDAYASANLSSRIYRGKNISTLAGFLVAAVGKEQLEKRAPLTPKKLGFLLEGLIKKEPVVR